MIHYKFEEQAKKAPYNTAVVHDCRELTYKELNDEADKLSRVILSRLRDRRSYLNSRNAPIAVFMDKGLEVIIAIIAILKAERPYVPLSPEYPGLRIGYILQNTSTPLILSQSKYMDDLKKIKKKSRLDAELIDVGDISDAISENSKPYPHKPDDDRLAYIIYTSGTTGQPKGVMISHKNVIHSVNAQIKLFKIHQCRRMLQFASIVFDVSAFEIFACLLSGNRLHIAGEEERRDLDLLSHLLVKHKIDFAAFPPAVLESLSEESVKHLKTIVIGGEPPSSSLVRKYTSLTNLYNAYGPTETTVCACAHLYKAGDSAANIGKAIDNTLLYVVSKKMKLVSKGQTGELLIGGEGVGKGYLNDPKFTKKAFIDNPFAIDAPQNGSIDKIYKTGDEVRLLGNGELEFVGRLDNQVKINGYRIEPGEIEAVLNNHIMVKKSVVIDREWNGKMSLLAYVVAENPAAFDDSGLKDFISNLLPEYMLPRLIIPIPAIPLTINGKLDKKALPAPRFISNQAYRPPHTEPEKLLVSIWQELFGINNIGVLENFFDLGGDSFTSLQFIALAKEKSLDVSLELLKARPTIEKLAERVSRLKSADETAREGLLSGEMPLSMSQSWFLNNIKYPDWAGTHMFLTLDMGINLKYVAKAISILKRHHEALRVRFKNVDGVWSQKMISGDRPDESIDYLDLSDLMSEYQWEKIERSVINSQDTLDIERGKCITTRVFDLGKNSPWVIHLLVHHLVTDGYSNRIIEDDFKRIYSRLLNNQPAVLPGKTTSFARWMNTLTQYVNNEKNKPCVDYWGKISFDKIDSLPVDYPGNNGLSTSKSYAYTYRNLCQTDSCKILNSVKARKDYSLSLLLITSLAYALSDYSKNDWLLLEVMDSGRGLAEEFGMDLSRTIGWLSFTSPMLLKVSRHQCPMEEKVIDIRNQIDSMPQIGARMTRLHKDKNVRKRLGAFPYIDVCLNYHGRFSRQESDSKDAYKSKFDTIVGKTNAFHIENECLNLLNVNVRIQNDCFHAGCVYSRKLFKESTIQNLIYEMLNYLSRFSSAV